MRSLPQVEDVTEKSVSQHGKLDSFLYSSQTPICIGMGNAIAGFPSFSGAIEFAFTWRHKYETKWLNTRQHWVRRPGAIATG